MFALSCGPVARAAFVLAFVIISAIVLEAPRDARAEDADAEPDSQAATRDSAATGEAATRPADAAAADAPATAEPAGAPEALDASVSEARLEPGTAPDAQPLQLFERIARAWSGGDADSLLVHFGEGKVSLAFSHGGPRGGLFTRTQAGYLLADLFKYSTTEKFEYVKFRNIEKDGQLPYAVADRVFRLENGILYHDQVYVSLRREASAWKIAEIKSIDR